MTTRHPPLSDPFGRRISYLRLSVTDRCDLRCRYCMAETMTFAPRAELLSADELWAVADAFVRRGVTRIRLTGGEPLVRSDIGAIASRLGALINRGLSELTLTTNGARLGRHAPVLAAAGVRRVNVSLDTLDPAAFRHITRVGDLAEVLEGIAAATRAGLSVKLNTVALRGLNEDQVEPLLAFAAAGGHDLTFIETMPLGAVEEDRTAHYWPLTDLRGRIEARHALDPLAWRTGGPARYFRVRETGQRIGFITPLTTSFCEGCNRVRVTATGQLYLCLGGGEKADLRAVLRGRPGDEVALDSAINAALALKPAAHDFRIDAPGAAPAQPRHMSVTGG